MSFHVGQLVVCVDASPCPCRCSVPVYRGHIYTVTDYWDDGDGGALLLGEVQPGLMHEAFWPWRFRPLDESKLQIFREMLVSPRKRVRTDA